jgi:hypothetical protein
LFFFFSRFDVVNEVNGDNSGIKNNIKRELKKCPKVVEKITVNGFYVHYHESFKPIIGV